MSMIKVEVAYALPDRQSIVEVSIAKGATVEEVIKLSNIQTLYPEIDLNQQKIGVWSRVAKLQDEVKDGDRIEIYRPLIADPKEVRKRRAEKAKQEGRADKVTGGRLNRLKKQ
ncbi:RnfH family protein [Alteromonas sp. ASW11-130]|uniref:RnfH family protein n=1 Tax=Alteromonas sp. ASW11-130 TaxID=3015775 RepID=UPI0022424778|nr:RnfH family protein [Alteromonas sp. ASW11-130]MCW8090228.1 RnfH family protein [Alteromonas sp. ASW11-130]